MSSLTPNAGPQGVSAAVPDSPGTNELLAGILSVLQKLDVRMDEQSKCIKALADRVTSSAPTVNYIPHSSSGKLVGLEEQGDLQTGPPPHFQAKLLADNNESSPKKDKSNDRIIMPPSMIADNKQQRDQFREEFASSPFGSRFFQTEKFANAAKMVNSILNDPVNPIEIFVEDPDGHVNQFDYTKDYDKSYLVSKPLNESVDRSTDAVTLAMNTVQELNLTAAHVPKVLYVDFPTPSVWIPGMRAFIRDRAPVETLKQIELQSIGSTHLGNLWAAPPDGRVDFSFQCHHLKWLGYQAGTKQILISGKSLRDLDNLEKSIRWDPCLIIEDYGLPLAPAPVQYLQTVRKVPKPTAEVSLIRRPDTSSTTGEFIAPWMRIVQFKGLSKLQGLIEKNQSSSPLTSEDDPLTPGPSFSHIFVSIDKDYHHNILRLLVQDTVEKHITCSRESRVHMQIPKFLTISYTNFHVTFFELIKSSLSLRSGYWKTGKLYSDDTNIGRARSSAESMCIRESACTILVIIDDKGEYWTALYMRPETFKRYIRSEHSEREDESIAADLLTQAVSCVINQWASIAKHLKAFIVDDDLLLDPEGHDRLLFDDDSFSRSRKYFWAINFLAECDSRIDENLQEINLAKTAWREKLGHLPWQHLDERIAKLREIQTRLRVKRSETIALRDGLFSASAVMESRASTRLGENVKLLTFVSIFFVPLSFCTSLWSINDQIMPLSALAITTTLVALITYLIVFNLNTLVNLSKRIYRRQRNKMIESMGLDVDKNWQDKGRRFKSFQPRLKIEKPSEWRIVLFIFRQLLRRAFWRRQESAGDESSINGRVKTEVPGENGESADQEEGGEDRVDAIGPIESKATNLIAASVIGDTVVPAIRSPRSLFSVFAKKPQGHEKRVGEV